MVLVHSVFRGRWCGTRFAGDPPIVTIISVVFSRWARWGLTSPELTVWPMTSSIVCHRWPPTARFNKPWKPFLFKRGYTFFHSALHWQLLFHNVIISCKTANDGSSHAPAPEIDVWICSRTDYFIFLHDPLWHAKEKIHPHDDNRVP